MHKKCIKNAKKMQKKCMNILTQIQKRSKNNIENNQDSFESSPLFEQKSKPHMIFNLVCIKEISEIRSIFDRLQVVQARQLDWKIFR